MNKFLRSYHILLLHYIGHMQWESFPGIQWMYPHSLAYLFFPSLYRSSLLHFSIQKHTVQRRIPCGILFITMGVNKQCIHAYTVAFVKASYLEGCIRLEIILMFTSSGSTKCEQSLTKVHVTSMEVRNYKSVLHICAFAICIAWWDEYVACLWLHGIHLYRLYNNDY